MAHRRELTGTLKMILTGLVLVSCLTPLLASSYDRPFQERKFVSKPNDIKKIRMNIEKQQKNEVAQAHVPAAGQAPSSPVSQPDKSGFQWGKLAGMAIKLLVGGQKDGYNDRTDTITDLAYMSFMHQNGELTWTKMASLAMEIVLRLLGGGESNNIDRQDVGPTPIENILSAVIAYITGSQDPNEVNVMARQASELLSMVVSLCDALRTSFSQRSLNARSLGSSDTLADVGVASSSLMKGLLRSYQTEDETCIQRALCEANNECALGSNDSGYFLCQLGTYGLSYLLESSTRVGFEIFNDAGRRGRVGEDCDFIFSECNHV